MPSLADTYQSLVSDPNFKTDTEAQQLAAKLQAKAAPVYHSLVSDPGFATDKDAQQIAHQLRASGIVNDQTQGGMAKAPAGVASSFVGKDFGSMGCADGVCAIASKAGLPVPKTASAREFESQLPQYGWVQTNDPNRAQIFTGPGSGNSGRHVGWIEGGKSYQADHVGSNGPDTTVQAYSIPGGAGYKYWTHASVASQPAAKVQPNVPMTPIIPPAAPGQIPVGMATAQVGSLLRDNNVPIDRNMSKYLKSYASADNLIGNLNPGLAAVTQAARADNAHTADLASLPPPDQSSLSDDIKRFGQTPSRQMVNGITVATFKSPSGKSFQIFYGGGQPGDADYGKRLPSSDPRVASVVGAPRPSTGDVLSQQVQDYGSNLMAGAVKNANATPPDMSSNPLLASMQRGYQKVNAFGPYLAGSLIKGGPSVVQGTAKFAQDAGLGQPMKPISSQTNAIEQQQKQTFNEDVKGMAGLGNGGLLTRVYNGGNPNVKNLQQIIKGEVAYTADNPLIAVLNVLPFAEGVGKLSTVGARVAGRIGAGGMARLGDSVLAQAAKTTDAAAASALTAKGMQYHQIAAALKAGKNVGALQFAMGYQGPDMSTGKTIAETTGYKPTPANEPIQSPVDANPQPLYTPKTAPNGKPIIKTLQATAPDVPVGKPINAPPRVEVGSAAFDKPTVSAWQEPSTATPAVDTPHHANFQPRDESGTFTPGQPAVPAGMLAAKDVTELSPVLQKTFGFTPEKADAVAALYDARARTWAAENNRPVSDWYANKLFTQGWGSADVATTPTPESTVQPPLKTTPSPAQAEPQGRTVSMDVQGQTRTADLTPLQASAWDAEQAQYATRKQSIENTWGNKTRTDGRKQWDAEPTTKASYDSAMKSAAMQNAANRRNISGLHTPAETKALADREATNYVGKSVRVGGKSGTVTGNAFGKVKVKFDNGPERSFAPSEVTSDPNILHQRRSGSAQAAVDFTKDGRVIVRALSKPNVSSAIHELAHMMRRDLPKADVATVEAHYGVKNGKWQTAHEERLARNFERYLRDGNAPTKVLESPFAKMKQWMRGIYARVKGTPLEEAVHPTVKDLFDKALGKGREEAAAPPAEKPRVSISSAETRPEATATQAAKGAPDRVNGVNIDRRAVEPEAKATLQSTAESAGPITRQTHTQVVDKGRAIGLQNKDLVDPKDLSVDKPYPYPAGYSVESFGHALRELDTHNAVAAKRAEIDYQDDPTPANAKKMADANLDLQKSNRHAQFIASQSGGALGAHRIDAGPFRSFVSADIFNPAGKPPPVKSGAFGEANKLFTKDRGASALAAIKSGDVRLFQKAVSPAIEYGGYLLEGGLRKYPEWFKQMKADVGDKLTDAEIRTVWNKLRPEAQRRADQLNSPKEAMRKLLLQTTEDPKTVERIGKDLAGIKENKDGSLPPNEARKLAELASKYTSEGWVGTFKHGLRAAMLSGPGTLKKIALLHILGASFEEHIVRPIGTVHSAARTALTGAERTTTMNPLHTAKAIGAGVKSVPRAISTLLHGENQLTLRGKNPLHSPDSPLRSEYNLGLNRAADRVSNPVGKAALKGTNAAVNVVVRLPMRTHAALYHMIGSTLYHRGMLEAATLQAMKDVKAGTTSLKASARADELMRHPTPEMMDHAHAFYSEQMYQNPNAAASALRGLPTKMTANVPALKPIVDAAVNYEAPFATVPLNVSGRAVESSPLGAVKYVAQAVQEVKDLKSGKKLDAAKMANMDRVFGRALGGTAATAFGYHILKNAMTAPDSDKGQFSPTVKVPKGPWPFSGRTVETGEVAPVMNGVNFLKAHNSGSPFMDQAEAAVGRTPYTSILDELDQIREGKGNYVNRIIGSELGKLIPAFLRQSAAEHDPTHSVRAKKTVGDYLANAIDGAPRTFHGQALTRQALPVLQGLGGATHPERGGYSALRNEATKPVPPGIAALQNALDTRTLLQADAKGKATSKQDLGLKIAESKIAKSLIRVVGPHFDSKTPASPVEIDRINKLLAAAARIRAIRAKLLATK